MGVSRPCTMRPWERSDRCAASWRTSCSRWPARSTGGASTSRRRSATCAWRSAGTSALAAMTRPGSGRSRACGSSRSPVRRSTLRSGPTVRSPVRRCASVSRGDGVLLEPSGAFTDAPMEPALPDDVRRRLAEVRFRGAALEIGELRLAEGVPFALDAAGFGRHTFLCGQSGSGKTYSLGLLLESRMVETEVPMVVREPNTYFAAMTETRPGAEVEAES